MLDLRILGRPLSLRLSGLTGHTLLLHIERSVVLSLRSTGLRRAVAAAGRTRNPAMASDFRLKEQLPNLTNRIVGHLRRSGQHQPLGPLPAAAVRGGGRDPRRSEGSHLSRLPAPRGAAQRQRDLPRRRPDRWPARQADRADRPGVCSTKRASARRGSARRDATITRPKGRRSRSSSWNGFPNCGACWPPTCRPPTTATRPARVSTK